jgi:hypothetical protein
MKRLFNVRMLMLTALLLMGAFTTASAQRPALPIAADHPISIKGTGIATFIVDGSGNVTGANLALAGNATHLGLYASTGELQFTPDPDNRNIAHATGTATLTADNGDQVNAVMRDGILDVTTGLGYGSLQFVGGTGRFWRASGSVNFVVTQGFINGAYDATMVGTIRF